jgi:hypothetical protein
MKFVPYLACVPPNSSHLEKGQILEKFARGVAVAGDSVTLHRASNLIDADVAMIVGWVHENSKTASHLDLRKQVIDRQLQAGKLVLLADSNLFLYRVGKENLPHHYLRYSFNGVFPNTGIYCDTEVDPARWQQLSRDLDTPLKDYRDNGNHILLCLQRNSGWSMGSYDVMDWTHATIAKIRQHSDRPIVIRAHPGDKGSKDYLSPKNLIKKLGLFKNVRLSRPGSTLTDDLKNCWTVVAHNSSPTVGAAIEGYPVFVTDPDRSQCKDIANLDLASIETPVLVDRQAWAERLSMFHWSFKEIENGAAWSHMRKFIK